LRSEILALPLITEDINNTENFNEGEENETWASSEQKAEEGDLSLISQSPLVLDIHGKFRMHLIVRIQQLCGGAHVREQIREPG
jgi:hypothetical protein